MKASKTTVDGKKIRLVQCLCGNGKTWYRVDVKRRIYSWKYEWKELRFFCDYNSALEFYNGLLTGYTEITVFENDIAKG